MGFLQQFLGKQPTRPLSQQSLPDAGRHNSSVARDIRLVRANDTTQRRAYYFLRIHSLKLLQFQHDVKNKGSLDLKDYGEVIESGYGSVPEAVLLRMGWNPA